MTDTNTAALPGSEFLWRAVALAAGGGGALLLTTRTGPISLSVLLLVVALAASGVLLGPEGSASAEGSGASGPDLSARLGLGLLGGVLGAGLSALVLLVFDGAGVPSWFSVELAAIGSGAELLSHLGSGAVWGMVLGILYTLTPGATGRARGALFSVAPTLYLLFKVYPMDQNVGWMGIELGTFTFLFVFVLNLVWGMVAGATIGWAEVSEERPVARPIDA